MRPRVDAPLFDNVQMSSMDFEFPDDFFVPPLVRGDDWPDNPELRRAVDWLKTFLPEADWHKRREAAARRLYQAALSDPGDPTGKGRFFAETDTFGWYLFQAEAFLDHIHNYEPMFGSRVVPLFAAIGRDLPLLQGVVGLEPRVRRLVGREKRQPNGGLFELLVAAAYRRAGAEVDFLEERPGRAKTHDMNVRFGSRSWAVECKRMETGNYSERERARMRELWSPVSDGLTRIERSVFCDAHFAAEVQAVPAEYLARKVEQWLASSLPSLLWNDEIGYGAVGDLDLGPLRSVLATDDVMGASSRILELLSGRYIRNANYVSAMRVNLADNPRWIDDCDLAVLLRWDTTSTAAIDGKARDIMKKLAEATEQLPGDTPSIVHIGFEAVDGDHVERARYEKILASARRFDSEGKLLEYVYCHYFVPESPPDEAWAYDETTQFCPIRPQGPPPLDQLFLVIPTAVDSRPGPHWES